MSDLPPNPRQTISAWLPHVLMLAVLVIAVWLTLRVFAPLRDAILLGTAIAVLTSPVVFEPINALAARWFPGLQRATRRNVVALISTIVLLIGLVSPGVFAVIGAIGDLREGFDIFVGVAMRDAEQIQRLADIITEQALRLQLEYKLPIEAQEVRTQFLQALNEAGNFAPTFLSFLFKGTGSIIAKYILAFVVSTFCYANAPYLVRLILDFSPLDEEQSRELLHTHRVAVLRLLYDTIALALVKGFVFGVVMWTFAKLFGLAFFDNIVLVSLLAAFISLVPAVGVTVVWVPMALVLWNEHQPWAAALMVVLVYGVNLLIDAGHRRLGRRLGERNRWRGLALFLGIIGGVLGFGLEGLIVGPTAVVITAVLGSFWLPLYGFTGWQQAKEEATLITAIEPAAANTPSTTGTASTGETPHPGA
ncbi:MAG: AI-2E family transporter [Alphaproteobacteria bacterium]|nr:AI-2E family transporter [Alphaproteobacteria bacterium]MCB9797828.1 AI-2E family transporter [Alphaproteobacteria bacterium]